jgi:DNA-binding CsgD family transcriptional regulator
MEITAKPMINIAFSGLPAAVVDTLKTHMPDMSFGTVDDSNAIFDLFICSDTKPSFAPIAVPVLTLTRQTGQKLQSALRQTRQMIDDPALFLDTLSFQDATLNAAERSLTVGNQDIALTDKEANILALLLRYGKRPIHRQELLAKVWKYQPDTETHTVETHIYRLRQKLDAIPSLNGCLMTVDDGYCLKN